MSEFVTAVNVYIPQLELYSWVAKDLQTWIVNSRRIYQEAEDEVAKVTPGMFREFSQANEEGRSELLVSLLHLIAFTHWSEASRDSTNSNSSKQTNTALRKRNGMNGSTNGLRVCAKWQTRATQSCRRTKRPLKKLSSNLKASCLPCSNSTRKF